nr:conserved hypothetical protein [Kibdelosporangium sp. MJ126-NF4]CTQ90685.1 conserved hypothetical protein [Kibdelosporangium sp. MJ126-NF4]
MSTMTVIRYQTTPHTAQQNHQLIEQVFTQLAAQQPDGLHYAALRLDDGVSFLHLVNSDVEPSPLASLDAFTAFQRGLGDRIATSPTRTAATLIGSYQVLR